MAAGILDVVHTIGAGLATKPVGIRAGVRLTDLCPSHVGART